MERVNLKTFPKPIDKKKWSEYDFLAAMLWIKDFEVDVRRKFEATKEMGLFERELWLSRLVVGILADVPENILKIIDNSWEELLKE